MPFTHPPRPAAGPRRAVRPAPRVRTFNPRPQALALVMLLVAAFAVLAAGAGAVDMAIVLAVGLCMQALCLWTCAKESAR